MRFMTQTDRNKIIEMTGVTHIYIIENQRTRSGAFKTDYFGGRLLEMATGKVIAVLLLGSNCILERLIQNRR